MMSNPVALGSSVPQWPTFLIANRRRIASTTSCDVGPEGLSMRTAPSKESNVCISNYFPNTIKVHFAANGVGTGLQERGVAIFARRDTDDANLLSGAAQLAHQFLAFAVVEVVIHQHHVIPIRGQPGPGA